MKCILPKDLWILTLLILLVSVPESLNCTQQRNEIRCSQVQAQNDTSLLGSLQ